MKLTLIGYGIIGEVWARHYRTDGHELAIWNRTPKQVPGFEPDLARAVSGAECVHIVVADPPAVQQVLDQILPALNPGTLIMQSSTISPKSSTSFRQQAEKKGICYVEAPFTGSLPAAENRENVFYVGGEAKSKQRAIPVLKPLSKEIFDLGSNAQASAVKLAMNLQIAAICQSLSEGLTLSRQAGVPDEIFFAVLEQNVARSGVSQLKKNKLCGADFSPQFSMKHMYKDLRLAVDSGSTDSLPLTTRVNEIYRSGMEKGWGDLDFSALIRLLEK